MKPGRVFGIDVVDPELRLTVNPSRFGERFFVGAGLAHLLSFHHRLVIEHVCVTTFLPLVEGKCVTGPDFPQRWFVIQL